MFLKCFALGPSNLKRKTNSKHIPHICQTFKTCLDNISHTVYTFEIKCTELFLLIRMTVLNYANISLISSAKMYQLLLFSMKNRSEHLKKCVPLKFCFSKCSYHLSPGLTSCAIHIPVVSRGAGWAAGGCLWEARVMN